MTRSRATVCERMDIDSVKGARDVDMPSKDDSAGSEHDGDGEASCSA